MSLREVREAKGLTQYKAAKELGINRSQLCKWESGKVRPGRDALERLADYYGVTVDQLLGRTSTKEPA